MDYEPMIDPRFWLAAELVIIAGLVVVAGFGLSRWLSGRRTAPAKRGRQVDRT